MIFAMCLLCIGLVFFGDKLVVLVSGENYRGLGILAVVFAMGAFSEHLLMPLECGFQAISQGKVLFWSAFLRLVFSMTLGTALVWKFHAIGVGLGILFANGLVLGMLWFVFVKLTRSPAVSN